MPGAQNAAPATPAAAITSAACRSGDPLANVYHPTRLRVINACRTTGGTVVVIRHEDDGDYHVNIRPDDPSVLNAANVSDEGGALVVEIVPADEPGCTIGQPPRPSSGSYDYGHCTGANISPPLVGAHVFVTGPYVLDTAHGWMEIHSMWSVSTTAPTGLTSLPTNAPTAAPSSAQPPNPGDSKNCSDFPTYAAAKAWFDTYFPYYGDVAHLDGNHDGIPCESLPGAPSG